MIQMETQEPMPALKRAHQTHVMLMLTLWMGFGLLLITRGAMRARVEGISLGILALVVGGASLAATIRTCCMEKEADRGDPEAAQELTTGRRRPLKTIGIINGSLCALVGLIALLAACFAAEPTVRERIMMAVIGAILFTGSGWWALRSCRS